MDIDGLAEIVRQGFTHVNEKIDAQCDLQDERHGQNTGRLDKIEGTLKKVEVSSARHEERLKTLFARTGGETGRLRLYVGIFLAGGGAIWGIVKIITVFTGKGTP